MGLSIAILRGMPLFQPGMELAEEVVAALARAGDRLRSGDIVVVAQKIVSKSEGRIAELATVVPGHAAMELAARTERDPAIVQLILDESANILRATPTAIIARHHSGHVLANAGIDASNIEGSTVESGEEGRVLLWPQDPDASARAIRTHLFRLTGERPAVVIADSMGRAWRVGTLGTAIGAAGIVGVDDRRGKDTDLFGRTLQATVIAVADAIAAAAGLAMGEGAEGTPAVLVRGAGNWVTEEDGPGACSCVRPIEQDMFR